MRVCHLLPFEKEIQTEIGVLHGRSLRDQVERIRGDMQQSADLKGRGHLPVWTYILIVVLVSW